jgi:hypothetical protein
MVGYLPPEKNPSPFDLKTMNKRNRKKFGKS